MNAQSVLRPIRGLYAVTPDEASTDVLISKVTSAIAGGARFVQYRNKSASVNLRLQQARALKTLCETHGACLIVNDHVEVAVDVDAGGVHLGAEDGSDVDARRVLGRDKIVGVSCYNKLELALSAQDRGVDYIAFGSFFPSSVKPGAVHAPLTLLANARRELRIPIVAIGGITLANAPSLVAAGADALAVISALFADAAIEDTARRFSDLYEAGS